MSTEAQARKLFELLNVNVGYNTLSKPRAGQYGEKYSLTVILDKNTESKENLAVLSALMKLMSKGGPVDIKDESGLNSTGKFRLSFNSKDPMAVFDGLGKRIPQESIPNLGDGSKVNLQFVLVQGKFGALKYLEGVQIVEAVPYTPKARASSAMFGKVSDFEVSDKLEADLSSMFK